MQDLVIAMPTHRRSNKAIRSRKTSPRTLITYGPGGSSTTDINSESNETTPWGTIARIELQSRFQGRKSASACNLVHFQCPAAWRMQLRSIACDGYFPTEHMACIQGAMKYLTMSAAHNPALAVVLDGSGLIQIGHADNKRDLFQAGNRLYCQALNLLQSEIASPEAPSNGTIIAAIHVMQVCDMFTCMPFGGSSWRQHAQGISSLLKARRTRVPREEFKALLGGNLRMFGFWNGILSRKGINHVIVNVDPLETIAVRIPGALEDCDSLAGELPAKPSERTRRLLVCLEEIETELKTWSIAWYRNMRNPPFNLVQASAIPYLASTTDTFPQILDFTSLSNATDHVLCTSCLLLIRQAIVQIRTRISPESKVWKDVKAITDCADSLCMSIPYLCLPQHHLFGAHSTLGPLMVAWTWYRAQPPATNMGPRLEWCESTAKYLQFQRGFRMMRTDLGRVSLSDQTLAPHSMDNFLEC